jgi:glycerophosphoryl diester phosphodiesterase
MELLPSTLRGTLPFGARIAGPGIHLVKARPRLVRTLQAAGNRVFVWTVNDPDEIDMLIDLGVDGIITDRPAFVLKHIGR